MEIVYSTHIDNNEFDFDSQCLVRVSFLSIELLWKLD
jgi:hypothetical protein